MLEKIYTKKNILPLGEWDLEGWRETTSLCLIIQIVLEKEMETEKLERLNRK